MTWIVLAVLGLGAMGACVVVEVWRTVPPIGELLRKRLW